MSRLEAATGDSCPAKRPLSCDYKGSNHHTGDSSAPTANERSTNSNFPIGLPCVDPVRTGVGVDRWQQATSGLAPGARGQLGWPMTVRPEHVLAGRLRPAVGGDLAPDSLDVAEAASAAGP